MAWLAVDGDELCSEYIYEEVPYRDVDVWNSDAPYIKLPTGSIKKLIGKALTWDDEPVEI